MFRHGLADDTLGTKDPFDTTAQQVVLGVVGGPSEKTLKPLSAGAQLWE